MLIALFILGFMAFSLFVWWGTAEDARRLSEQANKRDEPGTRDK